jgi:hypothetical protein
MGVFHEYNVKTDKHIFDFQSIHIDNIFFPDVDDALLILGLTVNQFTKIVLNQFFSLN